MVPFVLVHGFVQQERPLTFKTSLNHNELLTIMNKEINGTVGLTSQRFSYERKVKVSVLNLKDLKAPEKIQSTRNNSKSWKFETKLFF